MPTFRIDNLRVPAVRQHPATTRLWREWCFVCVVCRRFRLLGLLLIAIMVVGAAAFVWLEPEKQHSFSRALYFTWSLIFGEPPEAFPQHWLLQTLFFLVPVLGLLVILDGIVEFSLLVRDRKRSERSWCTTMAQTFDDHIVLVGLGRLGFQAFQMLRKLGEPVVVLERSPENQFLEEVRRDGSPLFIVDGRREAVLHDLNIEKAKSIVLCTTDDLANLEIALDARKINPKIRVVLRMFDQNMADKVRGGFDIQIAMSQSALSAPSFAMAAVDGSIISTQVVDDCLVIMQRWFVRPNGPLFGRTVADVLREYGFGIVERRPATGAPQLFPPPETRLDDGDELVVQGAYEALMKLRKRSDETKVRISGSYGDGIEQLQHHSSGL